MKATLLRIIGYGVGECAYSLVLNSLFNFAMLYYTTALGLSPALTGAALGIAVLLELVGDPLMGHVSDRTRHRFGRRHPWMFAGGLLMTVCFHFLWAVPAALHGRELPLLFYLVAVNLLLRTGMTMYFVPYLALGFELCPDSAGRSKVQAVRQVMNMVANFAGPALAWSLFFGDAVSADGVKLLGTHEPLNFVHMGRAFSLAALLCVLATLWLTRGWMTDTRALPAAAGQTAEPFWSGLRQTFGAPPFKRVLGVIFLACAGMAWVSAFQPYVYVYFMKLIPWQKSVAHGGTMLGMAVGGLLSVWGAQRFGKKGAFLLGGALNVLSSGTLAALFLTGWVASGTARAFVLFTVLQMAFWLGNGLMLPTGVALIADLAADRQRLTGLSQDGVYAALFGLTMKVAFALTLAGSGGALRLIGFGAEGTLGALAPEVIWRLGLAMFLGGPLMTAAALAVIAPLKNLKEAHR